MTHPTSLSLSLSHFPPRYPIVLVSISVAVAARSRRFRARRPRTRPRLTKEWKKERNAERKVQTTESAFFLSFFFLRKELLDNIFYLLWLSHWVWERLTLSSLLEHAYCFFFGFGTRKRSFISDEEGSRSRFSTTAARFLRLRFLIISTEVGFGRKPQEKCFPKKKVFSLSGLHHRKEAVGSSGKTGKEGRKITFAPL